MADLRKSARPRLLLEDVAGLSRTEWDIPDRPSSYSKFRTKTLQNRLEEIEDKLHYLKAKFPAYKLAELGRDLPAYYTEIRRLEKDREEVVLELSKRRKSVTNVGSTAKLSGTDETSAIGSQIDFFRRECGWSYDKLAGKTGIDKKQIIAHVHGRAKPRPQTIKEYAQAFSKELEREITPANLRGWEK
jgi:DNA-binding XRE family transcriptional regulator